MKFSLIFLLLFAMWGCDSAAHQAAIAEIEELGGIVKSTENNSGSPAIEVRFINVSGARLEHLKGLKKLERLDLSLVSTITPAGVRKLQQALPRCDINKPLF